MGQGNHQKMVNFIACVPFVPSCGAGYMKMRRNSSEGRWLGLVSSFSFLSYL
jgi:hypothetical protein